MKTALFIPIDRIEDHLDSVLHHAMLHFKGSRMLLWNASGSAEVRQWLALQKEVYGFDEIEIDPHHSRAPLLAFRAALLVARELQKGLLFLNPHVMVNSQIGLEVQKTLKSRNRIGLIGVPTEGINRQKTYSYRHIQTFGAGNSTLHQRRIPLICTFISEGLIEKMNFQNLIGAQEPVSFYLSSLSRRLGFINVVLNKARAIQAPAQAKPRTVRESIRQLKIWSKVRHLKGNALDRYNYERPPIKFSSHL